MVNKKRSRRDRILELVNEKGSITTAELSSHFQVTNETIRKDLHYLDSAGCIKKTHGGANCIGTLFRELPSLQLEQYRSEKIKIAKSAARFLKNKIEYLINKHKKIMLYFSLIVVARQAIWQPCSILFILLRL